MSTDKNKNKEVPVFPNTGDHSSIAEELLAAVPEMELKCRAVKNSVAAGYFTLPEALENYGVGEIEYVTFLLGSNMPKMKRLPKSRQIFETIKTVIAIYGEALDDFSPEEQKAVHEIEKNTEGYASLVK